jgi:hypothetical protein
MPFAVHVNGVTVPDIDIDRPSGGNLSEDKMVIHDMIARKFCAS